MRSGRKLRIDSAHDAIGIRRIPRDAKSIRSTSLPGQASSLAVAPVQESEGQSGVSRVYRLHMIVRAEHLPRQVQLDKVVVEPPVCGPQPSAIAVQVPRRSQSRRQSVTEAEGDTRVLLAGQGQMFSLGSEPRLYRHAGQREPNGPARKPRQPC